MKYIMFLLALILSISSLHAAIITEVVGPVSMASYTQTNFTGEQIALAKFDTSKGNLLQVKINFTGYLEGDINFENMETESVSMNWNLAGGLTLLQGGAGLVTVAPGATGGENILAFDNNVDFAGISGRSYIKTASSSASTTLTSLSNDLNPYKGIGTVLFTVNANGTASVTGTTGSGAATFQVQTLVKGLGSVSLEYTYDNMEVGTVPEPAGMFFLGLLVFAVSAIVRKKL